MKYIILIYIYIFLSSTAIAIAMRRYIYCLNVDDGTTIRSPYHSPKEKDAILALLVLSGRTITRSQIEAELGLLKFKGVTNILQSRSSKSKKLLFKRK
jgi:hypothetical protein